MHVSILARAYARAQLQSREVLDVVILSKARNDSVAVGRLLRWCGLQATNGHVSLGSKYGGLRCD